VELAAARVRILTPLPSDVQKGLGSRHAHITLFHAPYIRPKASLGLPARARDPYDAAFTAATFQPGELQLEGCIASHSY
jgi:hypothetical protein